MLSVNVAVSKGVLSEMLWVNVTFIVINVFNVFNSILKSNVYHRLNLSIRLETYRCQYISVPTDTPLEMLSLLKGYNSINILKQELKSIQTSIQIALVDR